MPQPAQPGARPSNASRAGGALLFFATAAFALWQNRHLTVLWDLSYILENASRIALGQRPYRDFPFPYAPLTFCVQALILKVFGRAIWHHALYAAFSSGAASLLTWRIAVRLLPESLRERRWMALLLASPLVVLGTASIFPHPFYDSDCTLFVLFWLWLGLRAEEKGWPSRRAFLLGALAVVPLFIKQNTGLAFLCAVVGGSAWLVLRGRRGGGLLLAGAAAGMATALATVQLTVGLGNYYHWTIQFAASRRLPGLATMLGVYRGSELIANYLLVALAALLWLWPLGGSMARLRRVLAAALLAAPFLWAVVALWFEDNASDRAEVLLRVWPPVLVAAILLSLVRLGSGRSLRELMPLLALGTIHGAFLSQQLWGSTYALWPFFVLLLASLLGALAAKSEASLVPLALAGVVAALLMVAGGSYALSHERLQYVDLEGELPGPSPVPALKGLAIAGDWRPQFEQLLDFASRNMKADDAVLEIPGEDLFYFATGRTPKFPVILMDNTVNPYSAAELERLMRERNVRWVIVKRRMQLQEEPIAFRAALMQAVTGRYELAEELDNYEVYRLRP